jgi:hypothetical protein
MTSNIKKSIVFLLVLFIGINVNAQRKKRLADKATKEWKYDIECVNTGKKGSKLIKVWSYSKKRKYAISQAMKNAVHGILFKGFAGGGRSCTAFKPLITKEMSKKEYDQFYIDFFGDGKYGGEYTKYVTEANDGNIGPGDVVKVDKKTYKIGVYVNVMTDLLRKRLEEEGVIKGLSSGF